MEGSIDGVGMLGVHEICLGFGDIWGGLSAFLYTYATKNTPSTV